MIRKIRVTKYEPEVAFFKPATDIVLIGHAYAYRPYIVEQLVSLCVGTVTKSVGVSGDRMWYRKLGMTVASKPKPFDGWLA